MICRGRCSPSARQGAARLRGDASIAPYTLPDIRQSVCIRAVAARHTLLAIFAVGAVGGAIGGFLLGTVGRFLGGTVRRIVCLILCHRWLTPFKSSQVKSDLRFWPHR